MLARLRDDEPGYADAVVKEVLRTRPVLTIAARKLVAPLAVAGWELPAGVHVAPCIYLTHRRPELYPDPTAFRPERFLGDERARQLRVDPVRRRRAPLRRRRVRRDGDERGAARGRRARRRCAPTAPQSERMRRRSVTLTPERRSRVIAEPLRSTTPSAALLPPQPPDRELPDLLAGACRRAPGAPPARPARTRAGLARAPAPSARSPGVVTKRVARAADDGYRNPLVPGLRATADAERLAAALAWADARLEPPGPHPAVAEEPDQEEAIWLAFLLALVPPGAHELHEAIVASRPSWAERRGARHPRRRPAHDRPPTAPGPSAPARRPRPSSASRLDARAPLRPRLRAARAPRPRPRARATSC